MVHVEANPGGLHHFWGDTQFDGLVEVWSGAMVLDQRVVDLDCGFTYAWHNHALLWKNTAT